MNFYKLPRYLKKAITYGPQRTLAIIAERSKAKYFERTIRKKALSHTAASVWPVIAQLLDAEKKFSLFFKEFTKKDLSYKDNLLAQDSLQKADEAVSGCFDVLGSGKQCFTEIPWHEDFRITEDTHFNAQAFYKDISVQPGTTEQLVKDIKMPWELSRFQHLIFLGDAFKKTHDKKYAEAFTAQITDWLEKNPYLLGPNWVCPMDVGIRAVNWVIAFTYFKESDINENFWQQFICSLYDHMIYLEHNWEVYDSRTSNHYLSDLIGYFYLCWFFKGYKGIEKKALWCYQELLKECEKQIHDDGSDYEGSTYYHRLVTEIFYHVFLLAPELGFAVPSHFVTVLQNMMSFIAWCTPKQGKLIQIGDNDAGKIVTGIDNALVQSMAEKTEGVKTFASYGLTVLKNDIMHLSLRHHAYNALQPSGHFHNDVGSITLALNGNNIFVDPGSYTYTPSAIWRNRFRSATVHNTFFIEGHEPVPFDEHLFSLQLSERVHDGNDFYMKHDLYKRFGLRAHRRLEHSDSAIMLFDHWEYTGLVDPALVACWNFTLAPDIEVVHDASAIILKKNNETIARMQSSLYFEIIDGWYSPSYGIKIPCKQLRAKKIIDEKEVKIEISF